MVDWFKYGFGKEMSSYSETSFFHIDFSDAVYLKHEQSTSEEIQRIANNTVDSIVSTHPAPYSLLVSGGVDSQAMLLAWLYSGHKFSAISFQYVDDNDNIVNQHDLDTLSIFSEKFNVPIDFRKFNIINFLENESESMARKIKCSSPQIGAHAALAETIKDGTVILSGNALYKSKNMYDFTVFGIKRLKKDNLIPFFFLYDKHIAGAFLTLAEHKDMSVYSNKCDLYTVAGFNIIPQRNKYNGFERIKEIYDTQSYRVSTHDRIRFANRQSDRVFDILFRYKYTKFLKYQETVIFTYPKL